MKKVLLTIITAAVFLLLGMQNSSAAVINVPGDYTTIQAAVAAASPNDQIVVAAGTYPLVSTITINVSNLTISGAGVGSTYITGDISVGAHFFQILAPGFTLEDVEMVKTDKTGVQNLIWINASNTSILNSSIHGQFVIGEGDVSRALVVSAGLTGLLIDGNTFYGLRQPGYFSGPTYGTISNNYTYGTKGWVMEQGGMDFVNNTWGVNVYDIAILSGVSPTFYTNIVAVSEANNDAVIEDQRVSPAVLSVARVDGSTSFTTDLGGRYHPYPTIAPAITRVVAGGKILVAAGSYNEDLVVNKAARIYGAGSATTTISGPIGGAGTTMQITASNVLIDGFKITRDGNNPADWNLALNSAGIAIQGLTISNVEIRNCNFFGNRTAIDINNSNGHNIHHNIISNNRTGLIFRNQTDVLTVTDNTITDNWTVGILFLDASSGTNVPVQTAASCVFEHNNISGNWYGQVVDRQTGGSLPAPGANMKNFERNYWGTMSPVTSTANSTEPGYSALIPVIFGGTSTPPGGQPDILGTASANIDYRPWCNSDFSVCTYGGPGPVTTIGTAIRVSCSDVEFPITVSDLNEVGGISLTLNYDPSLLTYQSVSLNTAISSAVVNGTIPGTFILSYFTYPGFSLPDNTVLFTLRFTMNPAPTGTITNLSWAETPVEANEYGDIYGNAYAKSPFANYFIGNSFTFLPRPVVNTTTLNEYCTIQAAIDAASNGHTITVAAGNYPENLIINKDITLLGANAGQPCYGTRVDESVISGSSSVAVNIATDGVTIDGFSITNPGGNFAIYAEGRNNTLVTNNIISAVGNTALSGATHAVAFVMGSSANISGVTVTQNCISDIHGGENPALTGAAAKANNGSASAISLGWSNAAYDVENVLIANNIVSNVKSCTKDWLEGGKGAYGVLINVGASGSAAGKAVNPIISCNTISDLEGLWAHGVGLEGETPGAQVKNNRIDDLTDHKTPTDAVCVLIEDNAGAGSVVITDNSFTNMGLGIQNKMVALVNGEGNWWGTTGPIPALVSGTVDWKPFLDGGGSSTTVPCFTPTGLDIDCVGITLTETNVPVSCFGGSNGSIDLTVSGIAPFSYAWTATLGGSIPSGQEDDQDLSGLTAGTYTVVVTDGNECIETLTVVINVADATAPTITTCPPTQNIEGCAVSAIGPLAYSESLVVVGASDFTNAGGVATDNCSITYYAYQDTKTGTCPIVVSRTWTLKDGMGNTNTCVQTINVDDNTAPVITLPLANLTMECFDAAVVSAWAGTATALDACDGPVLVTPTYIAPTSCEAVVEVTFTAVDACGNSASATKSFSVDHVTPPAVPANGAKTVACPAAAVAPTSLPGVPDQQQLLVNTGMATPYWIDFTSIGQSFTCGTTGWLTQLDLRVGSLAAPQNFTLEIYQGSGIAGTLLYSGNHTISATGWQSMSIPQNVAPYLNAGSQYTFWITTIGFNQMGLFFTYPNAYTAGVSMDGCTSGCSPTYAWQQWPDYDLTFRTYMSVMPNVTDVCGTAIPTPTPVVSGTYNGCEGTIIYTYTYTDCASLSTDWTYTYTIERIDFTMPANGASTVACIASATQPVPPSVNDNCGNPITPVGPTIGGTYNGCEGTRTYTWKYTDCEGNWHNWVYTYTIERNDFTVPANPAPVEVACYSAIAAQLPVPPAVTDNCGNALTPTGPVESTPLPTCEGTVSYTWTYTDCELNTHDWVATFNIERNDFTVPANPAAVTVSCYSEIAALLPAPPAVTDNCGTLLIPTGPVESSPVPSCEGTVTYTWTYTDCEFNTHDWVATFTINYTGGLTIPAAGASTVSCPTAAVDPGAPAAIADACGRTVNAVLVGSTTPPACEGTVVWTYRYIACDGTTTADWTYTYTIEHLTAPAEFGGPVSQVGGNVECEVSPVAPAVLPVVKDVCGTTLTPSWESPVINPTNTISRVDTYGSGVNTSATAAAGKWYVDRYAPAGFTTALFGGDYRLKHSINAADGASGRPGGYSGAFYNTQGRKYNVGVNSVEIKLYIPADWATANKRMAGFWGTGIDANYAVSSYPIIEFTSDGNAPRFRAYDNGTWVNLGLPSGFAYDSWVTLKMELLPSKEFKLQAGDLSYTTVNLAVYNTVRLNNVILQGHNYDPANANLGVTYDIYWDDFSAVMCEGTLDYVYRYVDCAGLQYSWLYSYNVDHVTAPVVPANGGSTVSCVSAATVPSAPVVTDVCGVSLTGVLTSTVDDPVALSCEGTRTYTFTYTDCAGLSSNWSYVYTIDHATAPVEIGGPVAIASTVECVSAAVAPTVLPVVQDVCGNIIPAPVPAVSIDPACEGTKTYTYTYTDCAGLNFVWIYTYTIDHTIAPVQVGTPVPTSSTVECATAAVTPTVLPVVQDVCGAIIPAPVPVVSADPACEGTKTYTYTYADCAGLQYVWIYTYTIDHTIAPVVSAASNSSTVECESAAVPPTAPSGVDVCGNTIVPTGPVVGGTFSTYTTDFSSAVVLGNTAAPGVWYKDRYNPSGFVSQVNFGGDLRLKESISASDFQGYPSFYSTQGRGYDLMPNTSYAEIQLYIPSGWATTNKRMAGFWGVATDASNAVSAYPIVEFTSDGGVPRFRVWESGTGVWVDLGLPGGFAYDSWITLSMKLLATGEFELRAGSLLYTTISSAPDASIKLKSIILQGHNYDPNVPGQGVSYDIYWDNLGYQICEGTKTYTYTYTDCSGLSTNWVYTYTIDHTTIPAEVGGPVVNASTVECVSAAVVPPVLPVVKDVCGVTIPAPVPVVSPDPACEGNKTYTYTYADCAGLEFVWTYTYTIDRTIAPAEIGDPVSTASTVECASAAVAPAVLPVVKDVCGVTIPAPVPVVSPDPVCEGTKTYTYTYTDCAGLNFVWTYTYTISYTAGLTPPANGSSTVAGPAQAVNPGAPANILDACGRTVIPTYVGMEQTPDPVVCEGTIVYRYRYTACDNTTADWTYTYTVTKSTLSGTLKYNNVPKTPMNNVTLTLVETGATAITSGSGNFSFADLCPGTYTIAMTNSRTPGGINSTDAGAALGWFTAPFSIERVKFLAGEVTASNQINAGDAQKIQQYFVFGTPFARGTWTYWKSGVMSSANPPAAPEPNFTVTITGNTPNFDIYAMCVGDFNGSFTPSSSKSASSSLTLLNGNTIHAGVNQEIELPVRATYAMEVGAVSLIMDIPSDLVEVTGVRVNGSDEPASFTVNGNELRIGWNSLNPVNIPADGDFVVLNLRTTEAFVTGESIVLSLSADPLNELADGTFEVMEGAVLIVDNIDNLEVGLPESQANAIKLSNYPNPFRNSTTVTYSIPVDGKVKLEVQNLLGQTVTTLVEETQAAGNYSLKLDAEMLQQGIYSVVLKLSGKEGDLVRSIKLVVNK